ncbi:MAG: hypothetical protein E7627_09285 [Ruminococcaceae bacterium]|nr:hypothetical protein [Oscillospiraceae bacterium]
MNIFIIHSGQDIDYVNEKKTEIKNRCEKAHVLLLKYRLFWKREAKRLMKSAQMILYIVGKEGYKSKNIDWEIKEAKKQHKAIVIYNKDGHKLNASLFDKDPFTKENIPIAKEVKTIDDLVAIVEDYENGKHIHLFNENNLDYEKLFEQYKLFSDTSESLVARRQSVNSFYITTDTALITIAATAFSFNTDLITQLIITMVLTFPGFMLNRSWLKVMESYSLINSSKMKILGMLEKKLSASLFDAEWEAMSNKYNRQRYVSFSDRERLLPIIFNWVYAIVDVICGLIIIFTYIL